MSEPRFNPGLLAGAERVVAWRGEQSLLLSVMRCEVQALYQRLQQHTEQRWALCFDDSYRFTVALLACLYAGKTPVIPGHCRAALLDEMHDELDAVLCDMPLTVTLPVLRWDGAQCEGELPGMSADAALVLFTSGSTGTPRRVEKPLALLLQETAWIATLWREPLRDSRVIASVSHQHLYGLTFRILLPLSLQRPFSAQQILYSEQLAEQPAGNRYVFISSPAFLRRLDTALAFPACALIVSAGGELTWQEAQHSQTITGCGVSEIYGSTETGVIAWRSRLQADRPWRCFPDVRLQASADEHWQVFSPLIPQAQGWPLDDRLITTEDGGFHLAGRHDRIVKIEDKRVSLSEIERRVLALPGVLDAAALVLRRHGRQAIGVVLVLDISLTPEALAHCKRDWKNALQPWLEPLALPRYWRVVSVIPVTSQSKRAWPQIEELFHVAG